MAEVWKYFSKIENGEKAKCVKCPNKIISCKGSSTSGLNRHLLAIHNIPIKCSKRHLSDIADADPEGASGSSPKRTKFLQQPSLTAFAKRQSLAEIVSKLAALDGFSIHGICKSTFIRQSLSARQYELPKDKHNVMNLIHTFYESAKLATIEKIRTLKTKYLKFSLTLDEWTSIKNRRYLNVNLHSVDGTFFNLGLIRIDGICTAEIAKTLIETKLMEFDLNAPNIIASTTDGASVMKKFGRITSFQHQQCYLHGIHLAVVQTLYKKKIDTEFAEEENSSEEDGDNLSEDSCFENATNEILRPDIRDSLNRVRKIEKFFKSSPVKNSVLQNYFKMDHKKEISLILDCKTHWSSIERMLQRFLFVYNSISKALSDLNSSHYGVDDILVQLQELSETLKPINLAVEALGERKTNLLTSEGILKFLFEELQGLNNEFSNELLLTISQKVGERRNENLVSLIKYLQNKDIEGTIELPILPKFKIIKFAKELLSKIFDQFISESVEVEESEKSKNGEETERSSYNLNQKLADAINSSVKTNTPVIDQNFSKQIKNELHVYDNTNVLLENLSKLLNILKTIQPTSIESERVFSISSNFCTKKRFGLSDKSLIALFLKELFF